MMERIDALKCYHSTTKDRVASIMKNGLLPNSKPIWFKTKTPYIMLSLEPLPTLNGDNTIVLEISDPRIKLEYFNDPEGLRWAYKIEPKFIRLKRRNSGNNKICKSI